MTDDRILTPSKLSAYNNDEIGQNPHDDLADVSDPDDEYFARSDGEEIDPDDGTAAADQEWPPYLSPARSSVLSSRVGQYAESELVESPTNHSSQLPIFSVEEESEADLQTTAIPSSPSED